MISYQIDNDEYEALNTEKLISEFDAFFGKHQRKINRAVMAFVIAQLPVFFNNISELQDYIYNSLTNCSDMAEKTACVEILQQIAND